MIYGREILVILLSYVLGCISAGYYLTLIITGKDIRTFGSGSTGARNVGRLLGRAGFIATFLIDIAKGMLVAYTAAVLNINSTIMIVALLALLMGHIWPAQLSFRGGKGIAVVIGFLLIFDYRIIAIATIIFCLCLIISRKYEISVFISIVASSAIVIFLGYSAVNICLFVIIIIIILLAHRQHIIKYLPQFFSKRIHL
jgi:acyl phosphate:glycerol-3-phosphate acyltransferase